ncbi:MAG: hypothetical protein MRJ68_11210 [Nitrospira sp.]|nr:hypothetical protein [Nitrospira sp.]
MDELKPNRVDYASLVAKGVAGAIPYAGGIVAEIIGVLIPNQRLDRITRFLEKLDLRIGHLESKQTTVRLRERDTIDLFEDAAFQAARALSEERLAYLASLLGGNITDSTISYEETKRLLALLGQINDVEIIILASHDIMRHPQRDPEFWERHKAALTPRAPHSGSSEREMDEASIYNSYKQHLLQLQLIKPSFGFSFRRGEMPDFDRETGTIKASGIDLTWLGKLLLRRIDMVPSQTGERK